MYDIEDDERKDMDCEIRAFQAHSAKAARCLREE